MKISSHKESEAFKCIAIISTLQRATSLSQAAAMKIHPQCHSHICNCCSLWWIQRRTQLCTCCIWFLFWRDCQWFNYSRNPHNRLTQRSASSYLDSFVGYPRGCAAPGQVPCQCNTQGFLSKLKKTPPQTKINVTSKTPVGVISVVTLIRTDTTLDHSQKAEKVWFYIPLHLMWFQIDVRHGDLMSNLSLGWPVPPLGPVGKAHTLRELQPQSHHSTSWGPKSPQKLRKSHWCVPFTATFSKRRKIGALWSERCDAR